MEKNVLKHTGWLVVIVLLALSFLHQLPGLKVGGHVLRRVDLLNDVRFPAKPVDEPDTLLPPPPRVKPAFVDTCPTGMTCIEDYSDSTLRGMSLFYQALSRMSDGHRPVHIAYFGDSFIEADILTADVREMLQKRYGGCGVGFVPITSAINSFRPTVRHAFSGWESHSVMDSIGFNRNLQGVSGHYFIPKRGAYMELRGQTKYASLLDTCRRASIYFSCKDTVTLTARMNGKEIITRAFGAADNVQEMSVEGNIGSIRWIVEAADSTAFYGAYMDGDDGITLDNFSLCGTSGLSLGHIPMETLQAFNRLRPYDLIVLQYGLNVATTYGRDYNSYAKGMSHVITLLKQAFPEAGILVVSVGDRDYKDDDGNLRTMPGIRNLIRFQQNFAADNAVSFWNLYEAMGGETSMVKLVEATPALANQDYTHLNFRGGRHLAGLLYEALVYGKEQYDRRRAYENEP